MYAPLAGCLVQAEAGCESVGVGGGEEVWASGPHVRVGVASRLGMLRGMDASVVMRRRPDWGCWAEWTPCADVCGVQIVDVRRNGRHLLECAASRFRV